MRQIVKAEIRLLLKNRAVLATIFIYIVFFLFMFFQKAINTQSGFYQREIITPFYMMAFFGVLMCVTCQIPMSIILGILGGSCFENNTCGGAVLASGRIRFWLAKALCAALICLMTSMLIILLGLFLGMIIICSWRDFSLLRVIEYTFTMTIISFSKGFGAFVIAFLAKKSFAGIVGSVTISYVLSLLGGMIPALYQYLSGKYIYDILSSVFCVLAERGDSQLVIHVSTPNTLLPAIAFLSGLLAVEMLAIGIIASKREYEV